METADSKLMFAERGSLGFSLQNGLSKRSAVFQRARSETDDAQCRTFGFSRDGSYFAYCDSKGVKVVELATEREVLSAPLPRTTHVQFSPLANYIFTFEPFALYKGEEPGPNLRAWRVADGPRLAEWSQRRQTGWAPQWTDDERVCCRLVGSELFFHVDAHLEKYATKLVEPKLADYSISRGAPPYHVATYVPGTKGNPAVVKVLKYDGFAPVSNKTFWKADRVSLTWNPKGNALIVMAITDVDSTGKSYYGEQNLYLVTITGESCLVPLSKKGPVYSVDWHPDSKQFCVVYGYMPAKATLYNARGEATFDMGVGPRNECHYNQLGNVLLVCGFGNLAGNMEFWSPQDTKLICKIQVPDTTQFEWAPDGQHFLTATTTPRLRQDNGFAPSVLSPTRPLIVFRYRIWHYTGTLLGEEAFPQGRELWEVRWRPDAAAATPFDVHYLSAAEKARAGLTGQPRGDGNAYASLPAGAVKAGAYVPPQGRRKADQGALRGGGRGGGAGGGGSGGGGAPPPPPVDPEVAERLKKGKALKKKIEQIDMLVRRRDEGHTLEKNQLEKIDKRDELAQELAQMDIE